jgi:hypothetical protein
MCWLRTPIDAARRSRDSLTSTHRWYRESLANPVNVPDGVPAVQLSEAVYAAAPKGVTRDVPEALQGWSEASVTLSARRPLLSVVG